MKYNYCIGNFDGVHLGHQQLINKTIELSSDKFIAGAITFDPSIKAYFSKDANYKPITTTQQKKELLYQYGIQEVLIIPFDKTIERMAANDFIKYILNNLNIEYLICGFDYTFGYRGEGTVKTLLESEIKNFKVEVVNEYQINNQKVASSSIQSLIKEGQIDLVNQMLGREYIANTHENVLPLKGEFEIELNDKEILKADSEKINWYKKKKVKFLKEL